MPRTTGLLTLLPLMAAAASAQGIQVTAGASPYQVFQRDASNRAVLRVEGTADGRVVEARLIAKGLVIPGFDWYRYVSTFTWRCSAEGARLLAYTADYDWSLSGTLSEGWVDSVYEGGTLMWPPEVGPGDTWVAETIVTTTSSWAEPSTLKSAVSFEAVEASSTTVPAGTYDSLTVEQSSGGPWVPFYVHPTLGTLVDDFGQLTGSG